jgi:hypothetical protein
MPNPPKPIEVKRLTGNPGRRPLPKPNATIALPGGRVDPIRELGEAGQSLWDTVFHHGELWVSSRTDVQFLQMVCEQLDRREWLREIVTANPEEWHLIKQLNDLERLISGNLGLLGFTPADRTRLGLAEIKARTKLEQLQEKWKQGE